MSVPTLLVIDLQQGAFDGQLHPPIADAVPLMDHAVALVDAARRGGVPVIFVRHCEGPGELFVDGTPQGELHARLVPLPGEAVVNKRASSAFEDTDLGERLRAAGAQHLVVCGLQSEFCVSNTTRSALSLGYAVTVASDAHGTWPSDTAAATDIVAQVNNSLHAQGAALQTTAQLVRQLEAAA
jgi:nicotinamidase-related amidase